MSALTAAAGSAEASGTSVVPSVFHIAKSENRNEVHYALRVDDRCRPVGASALYPYWRMHEKGPGETEPLLYVERQVYGLLDLRVESEGVLTAKLRALPDRSIRVVVGPTPRGCDSRVETTISGVRVELVRVFVKVGWLGRATVRLEGRTPSAERVVEEISR
jgi:hypothetical protein